ncbi:MAG: hypothetical protein OEY56_12445 [Cyclobacteriaceae bacterium]|nr:hypothetical protein [Cyclobacteriaceae bacterium]
MCRYLLVLLLVCAGLFVYGQSTYLQSGGIRLGHSSGFTLKKFIVGEEAIEVLLSGRKEGCQLTAMYLFHEPMEIAFSENFYVFYGIGGHAGYERHFGKNKVLVNTNPYEYVFADKSYFVIGADLVLGLEYRWLSVPVSLGFDVKPYFNYMGMRYIDARFWDSAISFKYIF